MFALSQHFISYLSQFGAVCTFEDYPFYSLIQVIYSDIEKPHAQDRAPTRQHHWDLHHLVWVVSTLPPWWPASCAVGGEGRGNAHGQQMAGQHIIASSLHHCPKVPSLSHTYTEEGSHMCAMPMGTIAPLF